MYMKRKCIFTNKPADSKFTIGSDKQNWAKSVPCTKEYLEQRISNPPPPELEIRLVELFYEQELCRLRIDEYDAQMDEIRALISAGLPATKTYQKNKSATPEGATANFKARAIESGIADKLIPDKPLSKELTEPEEPVKVEKKVVKKKPDNLWD